MARKSRGHKLDVEPHEFLRRHGCAGLHQHVEPHTEAIGVEFFVTALPANAPQVEIQDPRDLFDGSECDNIRAVFEPAELNDAVKDFGLKVGNSGPLTS
jgi:hypothetical protein